MSRKHLALLVAAPLALGVPAMAQERPLPPTRITLPSDTLTDAASRKLDAEAGRIELPEVVVLGQDRTVRQVVSKRGTPGDKPRLLVPEYTPLSLFARRDNSRPLANDAAALRPRRLWASAAAGSFAARTADAGYSDRFEWGALRLAGWLDRSSGEFTNSQHAGGGLSGALSAPLQPGLTGRSTAALNWRHRGLHGGRQAQMKRRTWEGFWDGEADYRLDPLSTLRGGLQLAGAGVTSDTSGSRWQHAGNLFMELHGQYQRQINEITLRATARYSRESLSMEGDSLDRVSGFGQIRAELQTSLSRAWQLTAAIGLESCQADSNGSSRLAPSLHLAWIPSSRFGLSLAGWSGLQYRSFRERLAENPYMVQALPLAADDSPLSLQLRGELRPFPALLLEAGVVYGRYDGLHYWQREESTGLIALRRIGRIHLSTVQLGGRMEFNGGMALHGELEISGDHLDHAFSFDGRDHLPYRPKYSANAAWTMPLPWQMELEAMLIMKGERRRGFDLGGRLPGYILLNAGVSRRLTRGFTARLELVNLLDRDYVVWEGYKEPGLQLRGGVRWTY